jgi:uncharacterized protein YndB with AHSA1/START domain
MTIAPIIKSVTVKAPPARAFALFTGNIGKWWPPAMTIGKIPTIDIVLTPQVGGKWYQRDAKGNEIQWGKVLAWEPPGRVLLAWQLNTSFAYDPNLVTEVEVSFVPAESGGTTVTLTHRNLERFGTAAETHASSLSGGWPTLLGLFSTYVETQP